MKSKNKDKAPVTKKNKQSAKPTAKSQSDTIELKRKSTGNIVIVTPITKGKKKKVASKKAIKKVEKQSNSHPATKASKKVAPKSVKTIGITKLCVWLLENGITQKQLAGKTYCSTNTINRLVKYGHASKSVINMVASELKLPFNEVVELMKFSTPIKSSK